MEGSKLWTAVVKSQPKRTSGRTEEKNFCSHPLSAEGSLRFIVPFPQVVLSLTFLCPKSDPVLISDQARGQLNFTF